MASCVPVADEMEVERAWGNGSKEGKRNRRSVPEV